MNACLRNKLSLLALAICMAAIPVRALADLMEIEARDAFADSRAAEPTIEGTWLATVVGTNPPANFLSLATFLPGGQIVEESSASAIRTVAQGQWTRVGNRQYMRVMWILNFASPRTYSGMT